MERKHPCCQRSNEYDPYSYGAGYDPVANGFVASLARPGGNVTGLATLPPEISGKQLEILREVVPNLSRVAVLGSSTNTANARLLNEVNRLRRHLE